MADYPETSNRKNIFGKSKDTLISNYNSSQENPPLLQSPAALKIVQSCTESSRLSTAQFLEEADWRNVLVSILWATVKDITWPCAFQDLHRRSHLENSE